MPTRKGTAAASRRKRQLVKRLLDGVAIPKKSTETTPVLIDLASDISQSEQPSSNDVVTSSSSMLKRHEEAAAIVKKDKKTSPDPTLSSRTSSTLQTPGGRGGGGQSKEEDQLQPVSANKEFFYSPMYRRYFGLTPPNPRLYNPWLLEHYIDWYMNVYLEEEDLPWEWISVGNAAERAKQSEEEAKEEADKLAAAAATTTTTTSPASTEQP